MLNIRLVLIITPLFLSACNFLPIKSDNDDKSVSKDVDTVHIIHGQTEDKEATQLKFSHSTSLPADAEETEPVTYENVWLEIADNLHFDRHTDNATVRSKLQWYQRNQDYLDRVAERATPYLYFIVDKLKQENMPLELALLPIIESAYQPFAYSPSKASGIWQFIPATGRRFGLKQNWWYDGRRDIVAATNAALKYLKNLNKRFNGNWLHAIAAYNTGERNVERAIERNLKANKATDFWSLKLHRETRNYVPSLLAISEIVANAKKYNIKLKPIANQAYFAKINTGGQIDLATVAELSQLSIDDVYTLNPGFNRWATAPGGPHRILIPITKANEFERQLAALPEEQRISWQRHEIKDGDTLGQIAHRYGSNVAALKQANGLRNSRIRAGRSLLIPVAKQPLKNYTLSQEARLYKGLKRGKNSNEYIYKVKRGDNLWDIGRLYGVSVAQLCHWNSISRKSTLRLGQKLRIRVETEKGKTEFLQKAVAKQEDGKYKIDYQVQDGDSLWLISRRFGVSVANLRNWNNLTKGRYLQPGQNISVFTDKKPTGV